MSGEEGYFCRTCGERHDELPFSYSTEAPAYWSDDLAGNDASQLGDEQCVIDNKSFFVRAIIRLPVTDAAEEFEWGVWVSLGEDNFNLMSEAWELPGRESTAPMFGWLSTELAVYEESTLELKTMVHTQPIGARPLVELEPTDHRLAVEQREGITLARVRELAGILLHGE